jgi:hypothetical protein
MINEYDRIVLTIDIPNKGFLKGDIGTVVMIHKNGEGYEVEFFSLDGNTIDVITLLNSEIRPVRAKEIARVRELV